MKLPEFVFNDQTNCKAIIISCVIKPGFRAVIIFSSLKYSSIIHHGRMSSEARELPIRDINTNLKMTIGNSFLVDHKFIVIVSIQHKTLEYASNETDLSY
jgi:hypothetical protein